MRELIRLVSSAGTGSAYVTSKNRQRHPRRMRIQKYDAVVRRHVEFVEAKISSGRGQR